MPLGRESPVSLLPQGQVELMQFACFGLLSPSSSWQKSVILTHCQVGPPCSGVWLAATLPPGADAAIPCLHLRRRGYNLSANKAIWQARQGRAWGYRARIARSRSAIDGLTRYHETQYCAATACCNHAPARRGAWYVPLQLSLAYTVSSNVLALCRC